MGRPETFLRHLRRGALVTSHLKVAFWDKLHLWFEVGMPLRCLVVEQLVDKLSQTSAAQFMTCRNQLGAGLVCACQLQKVLLSGQKPHA